MEDTFSVPQILLILQLFFFPCRDWCYSGDGNWGIRYTIGILQKGYVPLKDVQEKLTFGKEKI